MTGTLYLVGTPIGNLEDITDRARGTLGAVGLIAAEDTRRTGRLLAALGIRGRLVSFFAGNEAERIPELLGHLRDGTDVAVVSDAGMPGLSDPGYRLVAACVEARIEVDVVPGPSAVVSALVVSGLPTDRFVFEGFLPRAGRKRSARMAQIAAEPRTIVLFESPRRVASTLRSILDACGDRKIAVVRELTKLHQEVLRGGLREVLQRIEARDAVLGEVVIVMEGAPEEGPSEDIDGVVRRAREMAAAGIRKREAARRASASSGVPARTIYQRLVGDQGTAAGSSRAADRRAERSE